MFHKILVAIDRSETSTQVFDEAIALAQADGADLMLLHVLSAEEEGSPDIYLMPSVEYYPALRANSWEFYQKQWQAFENQGLDLLRSHTEAATAAGVRTEFTQVSGSPGRTICDLARNWSADLIVMGRRGRSGLSELILGSVSNYVLHHAPCSVLIVQRPVNPSTQPAMSQLSGVGSELK